jgi:hypothetical protein
MQEIDFQAFPPHITPQSGSLPCPQITQIQTTIMINAPKMHLIEHVRVADKLLLRIVSSTLPPIMTPIYLMHLS